ncbi:MAG: hypothetical protein KBD78_11265 [Oligoflexales bacterium]|nr:hypothetical protein [Oligoflexales bacterium]
MAELDKITAGEAQSQIDDMQVIRFLSAIATALQEHGLMGVKESENFRMSLAAHRLKRQKTNSSLLLDLLDQRTEFIEIVTARYGMLALHANLQRFCLSPIIQQLFLQIERLCEVMLSQGRLNFNQTIDLYQYNVCERRVLLSNLLTYHCEVILQKIEATELEKELSAFLSHRMAQGSDRDIVVDRQIAEELGFKDVDFRFAATFEPTKILDCVKSLGLTLAQQLGQLFENLKLNLPQPQIIAQHTDAALEMFYFELRSMEKNELGYLPSLISMETARRSLQESLATISKYIEQLSYGLEQALRSYSHGEKKQRFEFANDLRRRLVMKLLSQGTQFATAQQAVATIETFCKDKQVQPNKIIGAELIKLHPNLSLDLLEVLRNEIEPSLTNKALLGSKEETMEYIKNLEKKLSSRRLAALASTVLLILFIALFPACGVKLPPKSKVIDQRPALPFEELEAAEPPKKQTIQKDTVSP